MSEISAASIIHRTDEKEYITGYWQKRSTGFANLRKAELHSEKQLLWQQEITRHLPQNRRLILAAAPAFLAFCWGRSTTLQALT